MIDTAKLCSDACGRWPGILSSLGVDAKYLKDVHGPCPICGGKDRFRFDDKGKGSFFCSHCGPGDGFDLIRKMNNWDFPKAKEAVAGVVGSVQVTEVKVEQDTQAKARYMRKIWTEAKPIVQGDPVWIYLSNRCGDPSNALSDLRCHHGLEHSASGGKHPAMLARMRSPDGKRGVGIHRTYLTSDGHKAQVDPVRMSYGEMGTVRLGTILGQAVGVAEGIETALCAAHLHDMPVWSAICANGLQTWGPPPGIREVVIYGDNDDSCAGQAAAWGLAKRLRAMGLMVSVRIPFDVGEDWADVLSRGSTA